MTKHGWLTSLISSSGQVISLLFFLMTISSLLSLYCTNLFRHNTRFLNKQFVFNGMNLVHRPLCFPIISVTLCVGFLSFSPHFFLYLPLSSVSVVYFNISYLYFSLFLIFLEQSLSRIRSFSIFLSFISNFASLSVPPLHSTLMIIPIT